MPRKARVLCDSRTYHVMIRGINRQSIFEDEEDKSTFLSLLVRYKQKCHFKLLGYCLMGNHAHLLIKLGDFELQSVFRRLNTAYAYYFNMKYDRTGHLFQDRYKSEPVTSDKQLHQVLRYIHLNPVKAGICSNPEKYKDSSYRDYMQGKSLLVNTHMILSMMKKKQLKQFTTERNQDCFMDNELYRISRVTDRKAKEIMWNIFGGNSAADFQRLEKPWNYLVLMKLRKKGLSINQISRLTGTSRRIVIEARKRLVS